MCFLNCSKVPSNRAFPTPNSFCPSWPDCHSFHSSICYNHTDTLWYFCFKQFPFRAIKTKKNQRIFIFIYSFSDTPLFFLFFFADLSFWPILFSFSLKNYFFLTFLARQVCWSWIHSIFVWQKIFIFPLLWADNFPRYRVLGW